MENTTDRGFFHFLADHRVDYIDFEEGRTTYCPSNYDIDVIIEFYEEGYAERFGGRRSGGTTLLTMLCLYTLYANKPAFFFTADRNTHSHVVNKFQSVDMDFYRVEHRRIKALALSQVTLEPFDTIGVTPKEKQCTVRNLGVSELRGYNFEGNLFVDNFGHLDTRDQDSILSILRMHVSTGSKLMVNY